MNASEYWGSFGYFKGNGEQVETFANPTHCTEDLYTATTREYIGDNP